MFLEKEYGSTLGYLDSIGFDLRWRDRLQKKLLEDEEPNIRWDAAIALVKLGDLSGNQTINNLLDRSYLNNFSEVDEEEKAQAIMVAIQVSSQFPSDNFVTKIVLVLNTR